MNKPIKDKTLAELTLEDKAFIIAARDICWIKEDLENDDYMFITSILMADGYTQLSIEKQANIITSEFDELISNSQEIKQTMTVSTMLNCVYNYAESILNILSKIYPNDD